MKKATFRSLLFSGCKKTLLFKKRFIFNQAVWILAEYHLLFHPFAAKSQCLESGLFAEMDWLVALRLKRHAADFAFFLTVLKERRMPPI